MHDCHNMSEAERAESNTAAIFLALGVGVGVALAISTVVFTKFLDWYFRLRLHHNVEIEIFALAFSWIIPVVTYLLYHQFTIPTWLTFGYPVSFGGVKRNICDASTAGQWPCFTWFSDVAGPGGWKYLFKPDPKLILFLLLLAYNIFFLRALAISLRKTKGDDPQRRSKKCRRCGHLRADIEMPELSNTK